MGRHGMRVAVFKVSGSELSGAHYGWQGTGDEGKELEGVALLGEPG